MSDKLRRSLVSIVTPSLNHAGYIKQAINSVLAQDYPYIEYTIVDGGSTDATLSILIQYTDQIKWISEPDQGLYDAVNKGWARSQGEYVGYLNSDDLLCPGALSLMVDYLEKHPDVAIVYGDYNRIDGNGKVLERVWAGKSDLATLLQHGNTIFTGTMLLRRSLLDKVGWLDISLKYAADYDFCVRVARQYNIGYIRQPLAMFRIHHDSKTQNSKWKMWQETFYVSYKYSHRKHISLYSRYYADRLFHLLPQSVLWQRALVPTRKILRRLWHLGS